MARIEIYTKEWCPYCLKAKALLRAKDIAYDEIDVTADEPRQAEMVERSGMRSVPQIFLDGDKVGGYDDLARLNATGELDRRLGRGEGRAAARRLRRRGHRRRPRRPHAPPCTPRART